MSENRQETSLHHQFPKASILQMPVAPSIGSGDRAEGFQLCPQMVIFKSKESTVHTAWSTPNVTELNYLFTAIKGFSSFSRIHSQASFPVVKRFLITIGTQANPEKTRDNSHCLLLHCPPQAARPTPAPPTERPPPDTAQRDAAILPGSAVSPACRHRAPAGLPSM